MWSIRDRILHACSALTPGVRDAFAWMILALVVICGFGIIGAILRLEAMLK